ncbi:acyl-ACP--UDP-N-acetylglucosamine O-acyltransferase [Hafnia psychrotolerans]|uniref:Acyl-[acyl-carrier-protein]--UDP-N-acetylglucosamine O-acyltransferase n=1 Tax=Hafnia psychrotolerans TaxID=1477018 RepID=A0ABQ1G2S4_9GAMM|nr:acyl-ACP--UDP-N-acetylglucosamine O-acyltransferase [Hafnia psychrotolerans]GGA35502.1 acyl-[acyl-carrier-protein]--UDP-N-acetylglucosamine O-acyltransferase [Hafnia psychrotolerans]
MISNTAIVASNSVIAPGATLGANVRIGAFCVIEANVVIDEGSVIASHSVISGHTHIGRNNIIGQFASIGEINQDLKFRGELTSVVIGNDNQIGKNSTIHRGTQQGAQSTRIGNNNRLLCNVHIGHDCVVGNSISIGDNTGLAGHVVVGDFARIGSMCAIHQFCVMGQWALIADQSGVVQDVPPYVCASGNHAVPEGFNALALPFLNANPSLKGILLSIYAQLFHDRVPIEDVKSEVLRLSAGYPLLCCFNEFFRLSTRGIIS